MENNFSPNVAQEAKLLSTEWFELKGKVLDLTDNIEQIKKIVELTESEVINPFFAVVDKSLDVLELIARIQSFIVEPWAELAKKGVDLVQESLNSLQTGQFHFLIVPPLRISRFAYTEPISLFGRRILTIEEIINDIYIKYNMEMSKIDISQFLQENQHTGLIGTYNMIEDSINDTGDPNRPQLSPHAAATGVVLLIIVPDPLRLLQLLNAIKILIGGNIIPGLRPFDLEAKPVSVEVDGERRVAIEVKPDMAAASRQFFSLIGKSPSSMVKTIRFSLKKIDENKDLDFQEIHSFNVFGFPSNINIYSRAGKYIDLEVESNYLYKYRCDMVVNDKEVLSSNEVLCHANLPYVGNYGLQSVFPDWRKITFYEFLFGKYLNPIFSAIRNILEFIKTMLKSPSDTLLGFVDFLRELVENIKGLINKITDIIKRILNCLVTILDNRIYGTAFYLDAAGEGNNALIEAYYNLLVKNPPKGLMSDLEKFKDNGLIITLTAVAPAGVGISGFQQLFGEQGMLNRNLELTSNNLTTISENIESLRRAYVEYGKRVEKYYSLVGEIITEL